MHDQTYKPAPNWGQVSAFLGLTLGLTFLLDLFLYLTVGYSATPGPGAGLLLQVQMLIPVTVAVALQLFAFKDSAISHLRESPRWFFLFYLAYALLYAFLAVGVVLVSNGISSATVTIYQMVVSVAIQILNVGGLIFLLVLRLVREWNSPVGVVG